MRTSKELKIKPLRNRNGLFHLRDGVRMFDEIRSGDLVAVREDKKSTSVLERAKRGEIMELCPIEFIGVPR